MRRLLSVGFLSFGMGDGRWQDAKHVALDFFDVFYKQNIYEIISKYVS